jgi:hypothetical protein
MSSLTEKMIELELRMKYPGEDLSEIDREYNVLSERLRALELKQQRDADEARGVDLLGCWMQNELVNLAAEFRSHKHDFNHFINEHFLPLQSKIFTQLPGCGCVESFRLNPVPGRPTRSPTMGREFYAIFPPTPPTLLQVSVPLPQMTPPPPSGVSWMAKTTRAMRTSKTPLMGQRAKQSSWQMVVRKEIQYLLEDLAETHGSYLVKQELERCRTPDGLHAVFYDFPIIIAISLNIPEILVIT